MPARDLYHDAVKHALVKDGWTITHDPFHLKWGRKDMYVDLGAEQLLGAEKAEAKIAVEVKSFLGKSEMLDLENALGQFTIYLDVMAKTEPARTLYLAVRQTTFQEIFDDPLGELLLENGRLRLIVFDEEKEMLLQWLP